MQRNVKMDEFSSSMIEKQTIYEIYRACRLCGAGAGYKMPIIQNVVDLDGAEVELKQKIRDCVNIEVNQDDKMPPLICELCVDKVNDFYEFLEMCRQTNKRTRLRLGLPPQTLPRGAPDAGDCILGVTEPVFVDNEDSNEPLLKSRGKQKRKDAKNKASPAQKKDMQKTKTDTRSLRSKAPSPPRLRGTKRSYDDDLSLSKLQQRSKRPSTPMPKSILKRERESWSEENSSEYSKLKWLRSREGGTNEMKTKRVKIVLNPLSPKNTKSTALNQNGQRSRPQSNIHKCQVCKANYNSVISLSNHMRSHKMSLQKYSPPKKNPRPLECKLCRRQFPNKQLQEIHQCGERQRTKHNTSSRRASTTKKVVKPVVKPNHLPPSRRPSSSRKKGEVAVDPKLLKQVRPSQVRIARCDPLLEKTVGDHYDVSEVNYDFGLDKNCIYPNFSPFRNLRIKFEPGYMVNIQDEIKEAFDMGDKYMQWDSENETDSDLEISDTKTVKSLLSLSLRTLHTSKVFGKVPKKRRKLNVDKAFDSIINTTDFNSKRPCDIADIINSLGDEKEKEENKTLDSGKDDNDSLFGDDKTPTVSNDDFDSLFSSKEDNVSDDTTVQSVDVERTCNNSVTLDSTQDRDSNGTNVSSDNIFECNVDIVQSNSEVDEKILNEKDNNKNATDLIPRDYKNDSKDVTLVDKELKIVSIVVPKTHVIDDKETENVTENNTEISNIIIQDKVTTASEDLEKEKEHLNEDDTQENDNLKRDNVENLHEVSLSIDDRAQKSEEINNVGKSANNQIEHNEEIKYNQNSDSSKSSNDKIIPKAEDKILTAAEKVETKHSMTKENNGSHVNGETEIAFNMDDLEDVSDSEMEESQLMQELDNQIGESESTNTKMDVCESDKTFTEYIVPASAKSTDLESISDDESCLND